MLPISNVSCYPTCILVYLIKPDMVITKDKLDVMVTQNKSESWGSLVAVVLRVSGLTATPRGEN
jgi:hypothetical protein